MGLQYDNFLWMPYIPIPSLLAPRQSQSSWHLSRRQRVAPHPQLHSICGDNHIIQRHTYTASHDHPAPPSQDTPCNKNRIKLLHRQTDTRLGLLNLWFSYLYIQTLIVLCPYWITGKLSLSFERKILFHSDDNYQFPILFNLYKMWNLLIWVKLLRQRNTSHVLFLFSTPTCVLGSIATVVEQQYLALKTTSTLDYFSKYGWNFLIDRYQKRCVQ